MNTIYIIVKSIYLSEIFCVFFEEIINGYYGSWATYRPGKGKFEISNINPHLINMLSYSFFGINGDGTICVLDDFDNSKLQFVFITFLVKFMSFLILQSIND